MALVRNSKHTRCSTLEDEPPDHLQSAGELLIKQLVRKQTNTNLNFHQQLQEKKEFERGVGFVALDELPIGSCSLQQFEEKRQQAEKLGELEGRGLSREEALVLVEGRRLSKAAPEAEAARQKYIDEKLQNVPLSPANYESVKRQDWELASSEKPNSVETRLYQFAVRNASAVPQDDFHPTDHPIHQLAAIEHSLLQTADPQAAARTIRRKRRQQVEANGEPQTIHYKVPDRLHSLWDSIESPVIVSKEPLQLKRKVTCKRQTLYMIQGGKIVPIVQENERIIEKPVTESKSKPSGQAFVASDISCENVEMSGRLSEEEIKKLPRFESYKQGDISKILYVKNLASNVTEDDIAAIFNKFQDPNENKIIYRLMVGKMRGQAFITFTSSEKAAAALEEVNGTIVKGKPLVIQYGRQKC